MPQWTTTKIIEALGGNAEVAKLTGRGVTAVCNWHHWPHFPPTLFLLMSQALLRRGVVAPPSLWRMEVETREVA